MGANLIQVDLPEVIGSIPIRLILKKEKMEKEVTDTNTLIAYLKEISMESSEQHPYIEEIIAKLRRLEVLEDLQRRRYRH